MTTMRFNIKGVIPALLTPFTKGGQEVDLDKAAAHATRLAKQGVAGLFVCGTTGEGQLMTMDERKRLAETVVKAVGKKIKVIIQSGCFDTAQTVELTRHAQECGCHATAVVAPGFFGYDDASLRLHYSTIAKAVPGFPVLMYNIPGCARNRLTPQFVAGMAKDFENIAGIKDSGGNMQSLSELAALAPKDFTIINGVDEYTLQALVTGACASVSSTANVVPELFMEIHKQFHAGNLKKALDAQNKLSVACGLFHYGAMIAYYKEGLKLRGGDAGFVRPPQRELTAPERKAFEAALKSAGMI
jgi:dihydrodipicolinate synthase/N-acetylneuraminate lyase